MTCTGIIHVPKEGEVTAPIRYCAHCQLPCGPITYWIGNEQFHPDCWMRVEVLERESVIDYLARTEVNTVGAPADSRLIAAGVISED